MKHSRKVFTVEVCVRSNKFLLLLVLMQVIERSADLSLHMCCYGFKSFVFTKKVKDLKLFET